MHIVTRQKGRPAGRVLHLLGVRLLLCETRAFRRQIEVAIPAGPASRHLTDVGDVLLTNNVGVVLTGRLPVDNTLIKQLAETALAQKNMVCAICHGRHVAEPPMQCRS